MTGPQRRLLTFMIDGDEYRPMQLARLMWPDSRGWKKNARRHDNRSGAMGATMPMKAGTMLARLRTMGLVSRGVRDRWSFQITDSGRKALRS